MLANMLGWFLIIMGTLFLIKPQMLKKRLQKKFSKKIKRLLLSLAVFLGILFISAGLKSEGMLSKLLMVIGIISIFKGLLFLKTKAADKITEWVSNQPVLFFRIAALFNIILGIIIISK